MSKPTLVLASTSRYRGALLQRYHLQAEQITPRVDEAVLPLEVPRARAARLGNAKAASVLQQVTIVKRWLIIASDQVCHMNSNIFRKPGSATIAAQHLAEFSGRWVTFSTSLVLLNHDGQHFEMVEDYRLQFRELSDVDIEEYLESDQPYDCTGAIRVESYGLSLIKNTDGRDINSVYGLPVIALFEGLRELNYPIFDIR